MFTECVNPVAWLQQQQRNRHSLTLDMLRNHIQTGGKSPIDPAIKSDLSKVGVIVNGKIAPEVVAWLNNGTLNTSEIRAPKPAAPKTTESRQDEPLQESDLDWPEEFLRTPINVDSVLLERLERDIASGIKPSKTEIIASGFRDTYQDGLIVFRDKSGRISRIYDIQAPVS